MHLLSSSVSRSSLDRISLNSLTSPHFQDKDSEAYRNSIPRADTWRAGSDVAGREREGGLNVRLERGKLDVPLQFSVIWGK